MLIRVVDLETTGFEPPAAVCELGWCDLFHFQEAWHISPPANLLIDPEQPIPPETSAVHHIVDADVAGAPNFSEASRAAFFDEDRMQTADFVLAAHNARFERQWLTPEATGEAPWVCTYKCALRLWPEAPAHNNGTLRYWLNPADLERDRADPAHRAGPDAYVTAFLLRAMLALAPVADLIRWSGEPAMLVRCNFGKHRGTAWRDVPADYLQWILRQQMDEDVLFTARSELARRPSA